MELKEIAKDVYACLQVDQGLGWNNAGFINKGGGLAIDTLYDLHHTHKMIELYGTLSKNPIRYLVNTHHNGDHTWGNQLFSGSEIIAHRLCHKIMKEEMEADVVGIFQMAKANPESLPPELDWFLRDLNAFDFSDIKITLPSRLIDDELVLDLDGSICRIIYLGPAHTAGDLVIYLPDQHIVFGGDICWNGCTPLAWEGTQDKWIKAIDTILSWNPGVVVPGHGPPHGVDELLTLRTYLEFTYSAAKIGFDKGLTPLETAKQIDISAYSHWTEPERLVILIARAFREFRGDAWDDPFGEPIQLFTEFHQLRKHWLQSKEIK